MEVPGAIKTLPSISTSPIRLEKECTKALSSIWGSARVCDQGVGGAALLRTTMTIFVLLFVIYYEFLADVDEGFNLVLRLFCYTADYFPP